MIDESHIQGLLRLSGDRLYHREGQELEFKEQFSLAALADYFRDFAAFANNRGGYMIFGVKDTPRILIGMSEKSMDQFEKIDPQRISGFLLDIFSSDIRWAQGSVEIDHMSFGVFRIYPATIKPVIARKDGGKDNVIKNGEVYYRYGGRTQKIQSAELESIISNRIDQNNQHWLDLMAKIGRAGPQNAAILDSERAVIEKDDSRVLVIDKDLAGKLKFIKEGEFSEREGTETLKLVGDIVPVDHVEVIRRVKENLTKTYPLSASELATEVKRQLPDAKQNQIWSCIKENGLKVNEDYAAYNFRNKKHEDNYKKTREVPSVTPSIYNQAAADFIVKVLRDESKK